MKNTLLLSITLCLLMLGCKKKDAPEKFSLAAGIEIHIKSPDGKNLLDPNIPGYFRSEDINIYYLKNGVKERVSDMLMDTPENFRIAESEAGENYLILGVSQNPDQAGISTTYIEFNNGEFTDIVTAEIIKNSSVSYYNKVWYNNELKFDPATMKYPTIEVVKQ
jgi:hypothetical protein